MKQQEIMFELLQRTITPDNTKTYTAVGFLTLINLCESYLAEHGYHIISRNIELSGSKKVNNIIRNSLNQEDVVVSTIKATKLCVTYAIKPVGREGDEEIQRTFCVMSSHDKSRSIKFIAGTRVFVCTNGMVRTDGIVTFRTHTKYVFNDLTTKLDEAIAWIEPVYKETLQDIEVMKNTPVLTRDSENYIFGQLLDGILTPTQVKLAMEQRDKEDNVFKSGNMWSVYNWITDVLRDAHFRIRMKTLSRVHDIFMNYLIPQQRKELEIIRAIESINRLTNA